MKYLIILNKFELNNYALKNKIKAELSDAEFHDDNGLILETNKDVNEILYLEEIERIFPFYKDWQKLEFSKFKSNFENLKIKKHLVRVKFISKIPISAKSIIKKVNSALKSSIYNENPEKIIYIEFIKKQGIPHYRIFIIPSNYYDKFKMEKNNYSIEIVLENPEDKEEIKDFLRLCYIFNLPLNILTNKDISNLINKAKQEAKGIPYENFNLSINKNIEGIKIGFSINSKMNEFRKFYIKNKDNKISLIFGSEKFGLTQNLRDKLDYSFRLTKENRKPLRASHALSYVMGLIN